MARTKNDYRPTLVSLMSFLDGVAYAKETIFTEQRLRRITPSDILRWMNMKTFGVENPPLDANPLTAHSSSLAYWKKAISHFMPNCLMAWNSTAGIGNPTRSSEVNDLITRVKKKEVRRQGVESSAHRPLTHEEFCQQQTIFRESPGLDDLTRYGMPALFNFQSHMISRIDCASQWQKELFAPHDFFPQFAAKARLAWAKNVHEEGDAPWQIVFGLKEPLFCVFIGLAIWLEHYLSRAQGLSPYVFDFSGDFTVPRGGDKTNEYAQ